MSPLSKFHQLRVLGSGLRRELFVNYLGNFLFYLEISNCFITGSESAYHGGVTGRFPLPAPYFSDAESFVFNHGAQW